MKSGYIDLRGHQTWSLEYSNNGQPLLLLHGGLSTHEDWEKEILPAVERTHHVFAYDRTGHGRTGVREGHYHFDFQCDEAIAYLEDIVKEPAHLIGYSDGGIIALLVALKRPDLVKSMVLIGANYHWNSGGMVFDENADISWDEEEKAIWSSRSPDPIEVGIATVKKAFGIWGKEPNMTVEQLATISCPTLVLSGDDEPHSNHHTVELYEALADGRLAIIPGTSHHLLEEKNELATAVIIDFYTNLSFPITKWPRLRKGKLSK
jgi:pimeloyl-ACP methyl ester carboxylesterase